MILIEAVPHNVDMDKVTQQLTKIAGVERIVDLHVWSMSEGKAALIVHLVIDHKDPYEALRQATEVCHNLNIFHTTIQIEDMAFAKHKLYQC